MPTDILFMIVNQLVCDLYAQKPIVPTQLLNLASTCKRFRQLICPYIFKTCMFESNHSETVTLLLDLDTVSSSNTCEIKEPVFFICYINNFGSPKSTYIPTNILQYINVLTLSDFFQPISLLDTKTGKLITYSDCSMIVDPLIMPNLSIINITYCVHSSFWERTKHCADLGLYSYQPPLSVQLTFYTPMPQISQRLQKLVSSLTAVIETKCGHSFKLAWENISGMANLKTLSISPTDIEETPVICSESIDLVMRSLSSLTSLKNFYINEFDLMLPVDRSWLPGTVTTLECSTSNFTETMAPAVRKTNGNDAAIFFQSVKILTIVVKCDTAFSFKRLPFRNLTELRIIGNFAGLDQAGPTASKINGIIKNLIEQNIGIKRFFVVVSWRFDVALALKSLANAEQLSLSILEIAFQHNMSILDELFATLSVFCVNLRKLSVRVVSSYKLRPVLNDSFLAPFITRRCNNINLELSVHLKDVDERLAVRLEQKKGQPLEPEWYIPYLPLASTFGGSSQFVSRFRCKSCRKSLSYGNSYILYFVFEWKLRMKLKITNKISKLNAEKSIFK